METLDPFTLIVRLFVIWGILSILFICYRPYIFSSTKIQIAGIFTRLISTWLILFFLCTHYHVVISKALLPAFTFLLNLIQSDYTVTLSLMNNATETIKMDVILLRDIHPFIQGTPYFQYFYFLPFLQAIVLLPALSAAWPVRRILSRVFLVFISIPLSLLLLMLNVPVQMAASFETTFSKLASLKNLIRPDPLYQLWIDFIANGGNLILTLLLIIFATKLQRNLDIKTNSY